MALGGMPLELVSSSVLVNIFISDEEGCTEKQGRAAVWTWVTTTKGFVDGYETYEHWSILVKHVTSVGLRLTQHDCSLVLSWGISLVFSYCI